MLYAAYGSNINTKEMAKRCPNSKVYSYGWIKDYYLVSRTYLDIDKNPVTEKDDFLNATIVPVLLWDIAESDWKSLDYYEGYPTLYKKETIKVVDKPHGHSLVDAIFYNMVDKGESRPCMPDYQKRVREGYEEFGFNQQFLDDVFC